ncbi:MAG: diacylglycerol kinase family protein [bacterium]|nr:diacylglycerol kinase family protein [bacterium]
MESPRLSAGGSTEFLRNVSCEAVDEMFGIIVNPNAKKNLRGKFRPEDLETIMGKRAVIRSTSSLSQLRDVFSEFFDRGVKVICISGGDGSQHRTLTELIHFARDRKIELPLVYPIRGGVMNMIANEMATRSGNPASQCRGLCEFYEKACREQGEKIATDALPFATLPILKIEDPRAEKEMYAFTFSGGILFKALDQYNSGPRNLRSALDLGVRVVGGVVVRNHWFEPMPARVWADGKELPFRETLLTIAATIRKLVLWFSPFAPAEKPLLDAFYGYCLALSPWEITKHIPSYSRGTRKNERLFNQTTRELRVEGLNGYVLDGDVYSREKGFQARITAGPQLRFLTIK